VKPRDFSLLVGLLLLSGCASLPFLSKGQPGGGSPKGPEAGRPRDPALAILELEYEQQELARRQAGLQETLNTLKGTVERLQGESAKSKTQVEDLVARTVTLDDRLTVVQAGIEVKLLKLQEAVQKEIGARLGEIQAGLQALLAKSKELEVAIQAVQATQASLEREMEKLQAQGPSPKKTPRSRQPR